MATVSRSIKPDDGVPTSSALEPILPSARPPTLERGTVLSLNVTVLRITGPWVTLNIAGELFRVLRSRLEKEIN